MNSGQSFFGRLLVSHLRIHFYLRHKIRMASIFDIFGTTGGSITSRDDSHRFASSDMYISYYTYYDDTHYYQKTSTPEI